MNVTQQAADWFTRIREEELSKEDNRQFCEWLAESPQHVREYLSIAETWDRLRGAAGWPADSTAALLDTLRPSRHANVFPLQAAASSPQTRSLGARWRRRISPRASFAALAALCASLAAAYLLFQNANVYKTARGEQRSVVLGDGTVIQINTLSRIEVHFDKAFRRVSLPVGEAYFRVAHDATRPFIVETPDASVRAVGTEFDVYDRKDGTRVAVIEGKVAVGRADARSGEPAGEQSARKPAQPAPLGDLQPTRAAALIPVAAGQQITVSPNPSLSAPKSIDSSSPIAWIQRRIVLDNDSVTTAVAEFNRYNAVQISVQDAKLAELRITGVFDADDPNALLRYLRDFQRVRIDRGNDVIEIRR